MYLCLREMSHFKNYNKKIRVLIGIQIKDRNVRLGLFFVYTIDIDYYSSCTFISVLVHTGSFILSIEAAKNTSTQVRTCSV